jgi:hypothetical protein
MIRCGPTLGIAIGGVRPAVPDHGRASPHPRQHEGGAAGKVFISANPSVVVIPVPGLDPGINPGIARVDEVRGDPRIKSGDDVIPNRHPGTYRAMTRIVVPDATLRGRRWRTI